MRVFIENKTNTEINLDYLEEWIELFISPEFKLKRLLYILVDDEELLVVNRSYLDHDFYTDIISFDYTKRKRIEGECWISLDRVLENAKKEKSSFTQELNRVLCHGVLHFMGYKDKNESDQVEMRNMENECLNILLNSVSRES